MNKSAEQILLGMFNKIEYDGYGWWAEEVCVGRDETPPSFEEFYEKLEKRFCDEI